MRITKEHFQATAAGLERDGIVVHETVGIIRREVWAIIPEGTLIQVRFIIGETAAQFLAPMGGKYYRTVTTICVRGDQHLNDSGVSTWKHLRQAVKFRSLDDLPFDDSSVKWSRLRRACQIAGLPVTHIPGGDEPLHFRDELVVQDFSGTCGSHWYVIPRRRIRQLLRLVPKKQAATTNSESSTTTET